MNDSAINARQQCDEQTLSSTVTATFFLPTTKSSPEELALSSVTAEVARQACNESFDGVGGALGTPVTLSMRRNMLVERCCLS